MKWFLGSLLFLIFFVCNAQAGGLAEPVQTYPEAPTSAPFSWSGPYVGVHIGIATGTQTDDQSDIIPDPVLCEEGFAAVNGVCEEVQPVCPEGEFLQGGICVLDGSTVFCPANEIFDILRQECICAPRYFREPVTQRCIRIIAGDRFRLKGLVGGAHAGYNWQKGPLVYGIESDLDFTTLEGGANFAYPGNVTGRLSMNSDWQGSLRLRIGYAKDTWLLYGTGGIAVAQASLTGISPTFAASDTNIHLGWTLGAGIDKAFSPHWIGRLEARYTDFGAEKYDLGALGNGISSGWTQTTVSVGLSYKF